MPMKLHLLFVCLILVGCKAKQDTGIELGPKQVPEQFVMLNEQIELSEAEAILKSVSAKEVVDAYHLPWAGLDGQSGIHRYYHLKDGTCIQLCINQDKKVISYAVGPEGVNYPGKLKWFENDEKGLIAHPDKVKIPTE